VTEPNVTQLADDPQQLEAIEACCDTSKRIVAVTGEPGTGKTTILRQVYQSLTAAGYSVVLTAPTGKAAKRIQEATDIPAMTNHRLLEYPYPGERDEKTGNNLSPTDPKRDATNPLEYDVVLADEYAMATHEIHRNLINALPSGGVIRCFGDVNQLRPVELNKTLAKKPTAFMEILDKFIGIRLETNHRQGEGSNIIVNANAILKRRLPKRFDDFLITITDDPVSKVKLLVQESLAQGVDYSKTGDQIISPSKQSWVGTKKLNGVLQQMFNGHQTEWLDVPRHKWDMKGGPTLRVCRGDKVIWTQNNYNLDGREINADYRARPDPTNQIMNGESGIIVELSDMGEIVVDWGDRSTIIWPSVTALDANGRTVNFDPRKDLDLAYAITTHKAQGSEYNTVLYVLNKSTWFIQDRNNFYTAITRARRWVHVVTDQRSLSSSVQPPKELRR